MSLLQTPIAVATIFAGAGATLKLADHLGERGRSLQAYASAILSGFLLGMLAHIGAEESSYVFGIVLGVALGGKIDRPNLWAGLATVVAVALTLGIVSPIWWLVAGAALLSLVDEVGHDRVGNRAGSVGLIFRYRVGLKLGTVLLALMAMISLGTAVGFLCFDLSYDAVSALVGRRWSSTILG